MCIGDILITVATGDLDQAEADRTGLVPTHAYAVLEVREVLVGLLCHPSDFNSIRCFTVFRVTK